MQRILKFIWLCLKRGSLAALLLIAAVVGINMWMTLRAESRIYTRAEDVPVHGVALVLGTSKNTSSGNGNAHFNVRMKAAAALYQAGRVKHLLLSGDNSKQYYNEPQDMKDSLIARGVPASAITMDYAGLRTLDSVVRARDVFGVKRCVIISDDFHLARALWLADRHGLSSVCFHEKPITGPNASKSRTREWLARVKAVLDEFVLDTEPKFGGEKVEIPVEQ